MFRVLSEVTAITVSEFSGFESPTVVTGDYDSGLCGNPIDIRKGVVKPVGNTRCSMNETDEVTSSSTNCMGKPEEVRVIVFVEIIKHSTWFAVLSEVLLEIIIEIAMETCWCKEWAVSYL